MLASLFPCFTQQVSEAPLLLTAQSQPSRKIKMAHLILVIYFHPSPTEKETHSAVNAWQDDTARASGRANGS